MLKNLVQFKSVINDVESIFHFDQTCPIEIAKQALFDCLKWLGQVEDQVKAKQAASQSSSEAPVSEQQPVEPVEAPKE